MKLWNNGIGGSADRPLVLVGVLALFDGALLASAYSNNPAWWAADKAYAEMHARVEALVALDLAYMDRSTISKTLAKIGTMTGATQLAKGAAKP